MYSWSVRGLQWILDSYFALIPRIKVPKQKLACIKIIAHRGAHRQKSIENTLDSFRNSLKLGAWGIEFDIRWTLDEIAVVHHDEHCGRLFARPDLEISKVRFSDLREQVPVIPTLSEVVSEFGQHLHLMIELKTAPTSLQQKILNEHLKSLSPVKDYHWLCLDPTILDQFSLTEHKAKIAVAEFNPKEMAAHAIQNKWGGFAAHYALIKDAEICDLHSKGLGIAVGYIASRRSLEREMNRGVDWLFTNHIEAFPTWKARMVQSEG